MNDHQQLIALLAERSARRGHFTLASGRVSTLYIDARMTTMSPEGLPLIGRLGLNLRDGPLASSRLIRGAFRHPRIQPAQLHSPGPSDRQALDLAPRE